MGAHLSNLASLLLEGLSRVAARHKTCNIYLLVGAQPTRGRNLGRLDYCIRPYCKNTMSGFPQPKKRALVSGLGAISLTMMKLEAKAFPY